MKSIIKYLSIVTILTQLVACAEKKPQASLASQVTSIRYFENPGYVSLSDSWFFEINFDLLNKRGELNFSWNEPKQGSSFEVNEKTCNVSFTMDEKENDKIKSLLNSLRVIIERNSFAISDQSFAAFELKMKNGETKYYYPNQYKGLRSYFRIIDGGTELLEFIENWEKSLDHSQCPQI